jgi:quinolinate synthase
MNETFCDRIKAAKARLGDELAILAHHYQTEEVYRHCDFSGDSLELSRASSDCPATNIVFCGVFFMAESAAVLAGPRQKVFIPDVSAGCVLSEMAPAKLVRAVLSRFTASGRKIIPLTYVNSQAEVKAICGEHGGSVCTSANAKIMVQWALAQGDGVLFLPDKNLAANTCDALGIAPSRRKVLDVFMGGQAVEPAGLGRKDVLVWPGQCVIHARLKPAHLEAFRAANPGGLIVAHPECTPKVVALADSVGSTSHIIRFLEQAPKGATVGVGTEINMVSRLAGRFAAEKTVAPLISQGCRNMAKITEEKLARQLENLDRETPVSVGPEIAEPARLALTRMLDACAKA